MRALQKTRAAPVPSCERSPKLVNHGQHCLRQAIPPLQIQFKCVIETGGVTDAMLKHAGLVTKSHFLCKHSFLGAQPSAVSADGVDLAVVRYETKGLGQRPTRLGVGGIPLMKDRKGAYKFRVGKVWVERGQLFRRKQSLINN